MLMSKSFSLLQGCAMVNRPEQPQQPCIFRHISHKNDVKKPLWFHWSTGRLTHLIVWGMNIPDMENILPACLVAMVCQRSGLEFCSSDTTRQYSASWYWPTSPSVVLCVLGDSTTPCHWEEYFPSHWHCRWYQIGKQKARSRAVLLGCLEFQAILWK